MKFCKDCKHSVDPGYCHHPMNMKVDLWDGKQEPGASDFKTCTVLRKDPAFSRVFWCGSQARHFEQREVQVTLAEPAPRPWWKFWGGA